MLVGASVAVVTAVLTMLVEAWKRRWTVRQETDAWRRQALFAVAHEYLESAFVIGGISSNARRARLRGSSLEECQPLLDECHERHDAMIRNLTALRLLAPKWVLYRAEQVHDACHAQVNAAFGARVPNSDPAVSDARWQTLKDELDRERKELLAAIRTDFGLDGELGAVGAKAESSWTVPADSFELSDASARLRE